MSGTYALRTSAVAGGSLGFRLADGTSGVAAVRDAVTGRGVATLPVEGPAWHLDVPAQWPSSLYAVRFPGAEEDVHFALRPARPAASVLVSVPFLTWQAYNQAGVPGAGLYPTEGADRARSAGFDRSGGGPAGFWEAPFYAWLDRRGYRVDYCSNVDLHDGGVRLADYRLLVVAGHDEYWTWEMRDAVERFTALGGNVAFFGANTCWWQVRLEDDGRTMVCHRDALDDPMAAVDPARTTVEWSSGPVHRPENTMTGLSFRFGAGCWEDMGAMAREAYTVHFADHWVFAGAGLRDGDRFATGAIGYETDAADHRLVAGVPLVTGVDGTPSDFVVLASADLRHWRACGQGGGATMGVMRRGAGTVFNAGTIGWAGALDDPVVDRITRTVLDRLGGTGSWWEPMGRCDGVHALAVSERLLFGAHADGTLVVRPFRTQNLGWRPVDHVPGLRALAAPREAVGPSPVQLYGLFADGAIRARHPLPEPAPWRELYRAPEGACAIAAVHDRMHAATHDGAVWSRPLAAEPAARWSRTRSAPPLCAMANLSGRLAALTTDGRLLVDGPGADGWTCTDSDTELVALAATAGRLVGATRDGALRWRDATDLGRDTCAASSSPDAAA
jgi:hypothetical protein